MRLSSLVVAVLLLVPPVLFAQHSSGGGSSSSGSSSGGSSHSSSSSGSSSASHSSSHSSGGSASHSSSRSSGTSRDRVQHSRSGAVDAIRGPKDTHEQGHKTAEPGKNPRPEHRRFFAFLRHRSRKPAPDEAQLRRRVCPPGQSAGKNGKCVGTTTNTSNLCEGGYANGLSCFATTDACASIRGQAATAAAELRSINTEMQNACSGDPSGQQCSSIKQRHEAALARYRTLLNGAPANCRGTLVDPLSL